MVGKRAAGTGDDGVGMLRIGDGASVYGANITLRGADEDIASESVKQAIKKIIDEEDKSNPLSDQQIVELLAKRDGIQIARRTVAKYREMLGILSSSKRKKLF